MVAPTDSQKTWCMELVDTILDEDCLESSYSLAECRQLAANRLHLEWDVAPGVPETRDGAREAYEACLEYLAELVYARVGNDE